MAEKEKGKQMERPSKEQLDQQLSAWRTKIADLEEKVQATIAKDKESRKNDTTSTERGTLFEKVKAVNAEINELMEKKNEVFEKVKAIDSQRRELRTRLQENPKSEFKSVDSVDQEIRKLEFQLETGSGGLKREKAIMKQIRDLEASKKNVRDRDETQGELEGHDTSRTSLVEQVEGYAAKLKTLREERTSLSEQLDKLKEQGQQGRQASTANKEIEKLRAAINAAWDEIRKARADFDQRQKEYFEWKKEEDERRKARREAEQKRRDEEREQKRLAWEERQKAQQQKAREEERVKRLNPHEEKINIIDSLIAFLGQSSAKPVVKKTTTFNAEEFAKPGMTLMKKEDDEWLFGDRTKKKPQPKKPAATPEAKTDKVAKDPPLKLPLFRDQQFHTVEVAVPKKQSEVADTLTQLKLRKEYYLSFRKTQAEVDAELDAEDAARQKAAADKAAAAAAAAAEKAAGEQAETQEETATTEESQE